MRRYSKAVKADVRSRMSPPMRQSVARISVELGTHVVPLYKWRKTWRLQGGDRHPRKNLWAGALLTSSRRFWRPLDSMNATELSAYCRQKGLYPEQVHRWRKP